jgi:hypothetical protein
MDKKWKCLAAAGNLTSDQAHNFHSEVGYVERLYFAEMFIVYRIKIILEISFSHSLFLANVIILDFNGPFELQHKQIVHI